MRGTGSWAGRVSQISLLSLQKGGERVRGNGEAALSPQQTPWVQSCGPRAGREKAPSPNAQPGGQIGRQAGPPGRFLGGKEGLRTPGKDLRLVQTGSPSRPSPVPRGPLKGAQFPALSWGQELA